MKAVVTSVLGLALIIAVVAGLQAADDKEVTLKGTITCAKCDLKLSKKCETVIQVKDGDKTVTYYFDPAGHAKYHKPICQEAKKGTVTGTVEEKDGKKVITVKDVKFD